MKTEERHNYKAQIINACKNLLASKIGEITMAIREAQEAANNEQKSTAGDKHEVGKSMSQLTVEMLGNQLKELEILSQHFEKLSGELHHTVSTGSVVKFNEQFVFVCKGIGKISVSGAPVITVSPEAPLFTQIKGKKEGETFLLNGKQVLLQLVF